MNTSPQNAGELEEAAALVLARLLATVPWLAKPDITRNPAASQRPFDIAASLSLPGGNDILLFVECKLDPHPSLLPYVSGENRIIANKRRSTIPVLAAPYVAPRLAEVCQNRGWNWFDLAGNCRLNIPNLIYLERIGRPPSVSCPGPKTNLGSTEASRLIRVFLATENLVRRWTQRQLQQSAHPVSLGLVNKVTRWLREDAYLETLADDVGIRLQDPAGLLTAWNRDYRFDRHRRYGYFTLLSGRSLQARLVELGPRAGGEVANAAFSAADIQAPNVS